jgi:hypothetical protein
VSPPEPLRPRYGASRFDLTSHNVAHNNNWTYTRDGVIVGEIVRIKSGHMGCRAYFLGELIGVGRTPADAWILIEKMCVSEGLEAED